MIMAIHGKTPIGEDDLVSAAPRSNVLPSSVRALGTMTLDADLIWRSGHYHNGRLPRTLRRQAASWAGRLLSRLALPTTVLAAAPSTCRCTEETGWRNARWLKLRSRPGEPGRCLRFAFNRVSYTTSAAGRHLFVTLCSFRIGWFGRDAARPLIIPPGLMVSDSAVCGLCMRKIFLRYFWCFRLSLVV